MATTETERYRGYQIVPMRQWSQWTDIVERLRVRPLLANDDPDIAEWRKSMEEAADEIERLRDENTFLKKGNGGVCEAIDDASEEEMTLEEITAEIQQLLNASAENRSGVDVMKSRANRHARATGHWRRMGRRKKQTGRLTDKL
jgi:hypothetical protein